MRPWQGFPVFLSSSWGVPLLLVKRGTHGGFSRTSGSIRTQGGEVHPNADMQHDCGPRTNPKLVTSNKERGATPWGIRRPPLGVIRRMRAKVSHPNPLPPGTNFCANGKEVPCLLILGLPTPEGWTTCEFVHGQHHMHHREGNEKFVRRISRSRRERKNQRTLRGSAEWAQPT